MKIPVYLFDLCIYVIHVFLLLVQSNLHSSMFYFVTGRTRVSGGLTVSKKNLRSKITFVVRTWTMLRVKPWEVPEMGISTLGSCEN
jgi:hypothetical protein